MEQFFDYSLSLAVFSDKHGNMPPAVTCAEQSVDLADGGLQGECRHAAVFVAVIFFFIVAVGQWLEHEFYVPGHFGSPRRAYLLYHIGV